jgi:hypothetical protein
MDITGWFYSAGTGVFGRYFTLYDERDGEPFSRHFDIPRPYMPSVLHLYRAPLHGYTDGLRIPVSKNPDIQFREIYVGQGYGL